MYYSEELKLEVIKLVLEKKLTKAAAMRRYSIKGHSTICKWIKKYGNLPDISNKKGAIMSNPEQKLKEYKAKIKELEKQLSKKEAELEDKDLEARLYKRMIMLAEEVFDIKIKKNLEP